MESFSIHREARIGSVHLTVRNLLRTKQFYCDLLGFSERAYTGNALSLSANGSAPLLGFHENPEASPRSTRTTGLYHFCVLVPDRRVLARLLHRISETHTHVQGLVDHHFSESIYLADPDGNGIELSCDRARDVWQSWETFLRVGNAPLDVEGLNAALAASPASWDGLPDGTTIGHIHLHVGDLDEAEGFYHGVLGFDLMAQIPHQARFVAAGGYHHHIAFNLWAGAGALPPPPEAAGLRYFTIELPDRKEQDHLIDRVRRAGLPMEEDERGVILHDPSMNTVVLTSTSTSRS
ncbi:MAG: VOC family protein [Ignavibacteria bacterium]|nr:VOC family protein [Ignavibacteria bacterium]